MDIEKDLEESTCRLKFETECNNASPIPMNSRMKLIKNNSVGFSWSPVFLNLLFTAVYLGVFFPLNFLGFKLIGKTGFVCQDPSLSYKHKGDSIRLGQIFICSIFIPLGFFLIIEPMRNIKVSIKRVLNLTSIWWDYIVVGCIGWGLCTIAKIMIQKPRPDFFDYCGPDTAENCTAGKIVSSFNKCFNLPEDQDSEFYRWMSVSSFPSGHTMICVYCATFCSYFIESRFPTQRASIALKGCLHIVSLTFATIGTFSRYSDRRHHCSDILVGVALGIASGIYAIYLVNQKYNLKTCQIAVRDDYRRQMTNAYRE